MNLQLSESQNIDYEDFENKLLDFQDAFWKERRYRPELLPNGNHRHRCHNQKTGKKIKASLTTSGRQLRLANDKTQDLSNKKLTKGESNHESKIR